MTHRAPIDIKIMQNTKLQILDNTCRDESACSCCAVDMFTEKPPFWKRRKLITGGAAGLLMLAGLVINSIPEFNFAAQILYVLVVAVAGKDILLKAARSVMKRRLDMNCLMSLAAVGAFFIGHGEEGAAVIFLFFVAESLEEYAGEKAKQSIHQLLSLAPETAIVKREAGEIELHTHEIRIGDIIAIRPGGKVPLDGNVSTGHSYVNEAPITGESVPAEKTVGDKVYAGTLNEEGYLEVTVTKKADDTVLSRIVKLVGEAERKKSKTEKFIDKFARIYTPTVISLAFAAFLIPTVFLGLPWDEWLYRSLVLLVISCPCALAISTPVAMVSALTSAARHGVLIKGATYIEELSKIKAFAFDKTGTLTRGRLEVTDIISLNGNPQEGVLAIAASLESRSGHPIAKAILKKASEDNIRLQEVTAFQSIKGKGLRGEINGTVYYAGAKNLFDVISVKAPDKLLQLEAEGKTTILISTEDSVLGIIALGDKMRDNSPATISDLKKLNIRTEMLTGDNKEVASALANKTGVDEYYAGLLPEDKVKVVEKLAERFGSVAMVGDGVNDAPSLAAANVGIAMGTAGADVAIETADIALMHDDLSKIDYLIHLSRKTMMVVKQNVTASVIVKGSLTLLALMGFINLWTAVAVGDMGLSLAVILNAIRLTRVKA
ncbi:MAG: cadmium-translocating P-type ATPase [Nitrospirae bacterium]|nr:cadmium-translocating P-type ATPase [Nitrospirota bacterium]